MSQPSNDRLDTLFKPTQGRKLAILSGEAIRDRFFLGAAVGAWRLVDALQRLGAAAEFTLMLWFDDQGRTRFYTEQMQQRFEELARGTTNSRPGEPAKQVFQPRSRTASPPEAAAPVPTAAAESVSRTEAAASSSLRTLLGQLQRVMRSEERVLAIFENPEDLWHGPIPKEVLDQLKQVAALAFASDGHPESRLVLIVRPGRREELLQALDHIEETAAFREEFMIPVPGVAEVRGLMDLYMNREGLLGNRDQVVAECTQKGWFLHNFLESLRSIATLPPEQRRVERILERNANEETVEDVLRELDQMVGLKSVKARLTMLLDVAEQQADELRAGRTTEPASTHMLFLGNPGTGKTVVARLVARFLRASGLRSSGNFVEISRTNIASSFNSGDCIQRMRTAIDSATGGVLFVDEAYQLAEGEWMRGALETLMKDMEDRRGTLTVIFAGYEEQMQNLWNVNRGFRSRIPESNWITFPDYTLDELSELFRRECRQRQWKLSPEVEQRGTRFIRSEMARRRMDNARGVRNLLQTIGQNRAAAGGGDLTSPMVPEAARYDAPRVSNLLAQLDADFIGLSGMKEYLRKIARRARDADEQNEPLQGFVHCRFVGPPGTGKTTVARRVGEIFHAMGLLSTGKVREVNPVADFGSQYVGQYAQRVAEQFQLAKGGVLFIDEAYQLAEQDQGLQIIHQIVQTITQPNFADTLVVMAGYRDPMNRLVDLNQGLASRVPNEIVFEALTVNELAKLLFSKLEHRDYVVRSEDRESFDRILTARLRQDCNDQNFANARSLESLAQEIIDRQKDRLETTANPQLKRILPQDVGDASAQPNEIELLLQELDQRFVGMASVKNRFNTLAIDVHMQAELGGELPKAPRMQFLGNPGTGKTTAARALAGILRAAGVVSSDRLVETRGAELKGSYLGQTKDKVVNEFRNARGGVLFIDEAYSLGNNPGGMDSYAAEAIDTLVGLTELPEYAQTAIILAGYPGPMSEFLATNPGLARRFPMKVTFPDYSNGECLEILQRWFAAKNAGQSLPLDNPDIVETLNAAITQRRSAAHFGNAGDIETLGGYIVSARNSRLRSITLDRRQEQLRPTLEDIRQGVDEWLM